MNKLTFGSRCLIAFAATLLAAFSSACATRSVASPDAGGAGSEAGEQAAREGERIIGRCLSQLQIGQSMVRMRATIQDSDGAARVVDLTMLRKRLPDGAQWALAEFTSPQEERDRDALIKVSPKGDVEATRFMQSTGSFVTARSASDEESLFGMTLQELVDGQLEKYQFKLIDQDAAASGGPAYRLDGKLRPGSDSKFPRVVLLVSKESYTPLAAEFYDNHNEIARRVAIDKTAEVQGHWTRMKWTVDNRSRHKTIVFDLVEAKYDQSIPDSTFTEEHLKKIAFR